MQKTPKKKGEKKIVRNACSFAKSSPPQATPEVLRQSICACFGVFCAMSLQQFIWFFYFIFLKFLVFLVSFLSGNYAFAF